MLPKSLIPANCHKFDWVWAVERHGRDIMILMAFAIRAIASMCFLSNEPGQICAHHIELTWELSEASHQPTADANE
jgi:hypothetical protein